MIILGTNSIKATGFDVANSVRFDTNAYMHKTPGSAGSLTTWTFSTWIKRAKLGSSQNIFTSRNDGQNQTFAYFNSDDTVIFFDIDSNADQGKLITNRKFRDVGAWYNLTFIWNTTSGTAGDRIQLWVNGVRETSFSTQTNPDQNDASTMGDAHIIEVGRGGEDENYANFYMAETVYQNNSATTPVDKFGEYDTDSGIWKPINVSGLTFGNNSFYLDFENSAELGTDASGNSHTFTENNIAATDQSTDTCTNNFCTMNPNLGALYTPTFTQGNLQVAQSTNNQHAVTHGTFAVTKGVWYWEVKYIGNTGSSGPSDRAVGIQVPNVSNVLTQATYNSNGSITYYGYDGGEVWDEGTATSADYGTYSQNSILGISLDMDNSHISFYINGTEVVDNYALGDYASVIATPAISWPNGTASGTEMGVNFGSPFYALSSAVADANGYGSFEYTPVGYALCTKNLAEYG